MRAIELPDIITALPGLQVLSMREAVFIVSPKMLNLGSLVPTSPETHGPVCSPMRIVTGSLLCGILTCR